MLEDRIERLRKLQKESHAIMDDICDSLQGKCKESLFEILESILESVDEFADTESAVKTIESLLEGSSSRAHKSKDSSRKKEKKPKNDETH